MTEGVRETDGEMTEIRRDAISETIHYDLLTWLQDAAATATCPEETHDLLVGAIGGLAHFMWDVAAPGTTRETVAMELTAAARTILVQLPDQPESVQ